MAGLSQLRPQMDELGQESPLIPKRSYSAGQRQITAAAKRAGAGQSPAVPATEEAA